MKENIKLKKLENGLKIVLIPYKVETVTACLRGLAGSNYENSDEVGAAHILEHLQMLGSFNYNKENELQNLVLKNGGRITGTTSRDDVAFLVKSLKGYYRNSLMFLSEIFSRPLLTEKNLEIVKNIVKQEIYQNIDDPKRNIGRLAYKIMYPGQRFSKYNTGAIEDIENITLKKIVDFRNKYYAPENFVLSVCGNINEDDFVNFTKTIFSGIPAKKVDAKLTHTFNKDFAVITENRPSLNQLHLQIDYEGFKTNQKEKYSAYILAKILQSKLEKALKTSDENINTYIIDCASFSSNSYGLFGLYTALDPINLKGFLEIYKQVVNDLLLSEISDVEYENLKHKVYADFIFALEKTSLRADFYSELFLYKGITHSYNEEINNYLKCTKKEIHKVANQIFKQNPKITVIDKELKAEQIKTLWFS